MFIVECSIVIRDGAHVAQLVERVLGKDEVTSSILVVGSRKANRLADQLSHGMG